MSAALQAPASAAPAAVAPTPLWPERYGMLDGWRGLAAVAVVVHHVAPQAGLPGLAGLFLGHWAVMAFFVISGYCIAAAADACLRRGLSFRTFMRRRLRRIYPPYALAVAYFAATRVAKLALTGVNDIPTSPVQWVQNLTLTQWVTLLVNPGLYAPNNPTNFVSAYWSLGYEEQFYLVMALAMVATVRTGRSLLVWVGVLLAVAVVWVGALPRLSTGLFVDYWVPFAVGVLVFHRLCRLGSASHRRLVDGTLVALLLAGVWGTWFAGAAWDGQAKAAETVAVSAFALLLIALRPVSDSAMRSRAGTALATLGVLTYSLYLVHQCNLFVSARAADALGLAGWPSLGVQVALHVALAVPFYLVCERPFRNAPLVPGLTGADASASFKPATSTTPLQSL